VAVAVHVVDEDVTLRELLERVSRIVTPLSPT
jgi:hypothetical protein